MTSKKALPRFNPTQLQVLGSALSISAGVIAFALDYFYISYAPRDIWFLGGCLLIGAVCLTIGISWDAWRHLRHPS